MYPGTGMVTNTDHIEVCLEVDIVEAEGAVGIDIVEAQEVDTGIVEAAEAAELGTDCNFHQDAVDLGSRNIVDELTEDMSMRFDQMAGCIEASGKESHTAWFLAHWGHVNTLEIHIYFGKQ